MLETLQNIDSSIFLFIHNLARSSYLDSVTWWISDRWIWLPMYGAIIYWMYRRMGWRTAVIYAIAIGAAVACADQLCATVIRPLAERLRPANILSPISDSVNIVNDYRGGKYGFPSCHAANTFVLATFISFICHNRIVRTWMFTWAVLSCWSRIYLGVHYPGDLIIGATIGALCAYLIWTMIRLTGMSTQNPGECVGWKTPPVIIGVATLLTIAVIATF